MEQRGSFGVKGTGDTSGYGGLVRTKVNPGSSERPYGSYFDDVADELERRARVDEALNKEVNDYKGNLNDFNFAEARSRAVKSVNERQAKEKRLRELERKAAGGQ